MKEFTHLDSDGKIDMVDITDKKDSFRKTIAQGYIKLKKTTIKAIKEDEIQKGNVYATSKIAAIQSIKQTPNQIPLCHNIPITDIEVDFKTTEKKITTQVTVKTTSKTGVEMEALNGVSTALLTIWDMVKSKEKDNEGNYPQTKISEIKVLEKKKKEIK